MGIHEESMNHEMYCVSMVVAAAFFSLLLFRLFSIIFVRNTHNGTVIASEAKPITH